MTRWTTALATATTLGISLLTAGSTAAASSPDETAMVLTRGSHGYDHVDFTIDGRDVRGLYPGATKRLKLTITNREGFGLRILRLQGRLASTSRQGCPSTRSTLTINMYTGRLPLVVPAHSRTTIPGYLPITMPTNVTPRCANTKFVIGLQGTATRAGR